MNRTVDPTSESIRQLVAKVPADTPVVMLNLLRFREQAAYPADKEQPARSGREAYGIYAKATEEHLQRVGGKLIWRATAKHAFIAPEGEDWDEVLLVAYPSRDAFLTMIKSPGYQANTFHRTAALEDARLIVTTGSAALG